MGNLKLFKHFEISSYLKLDLKIEEPIDGLLNRNISTSDKELLTIKDQNKKKPSSGGLKKKLSWKT